MSGGIPPGISGNPVVAAAAEAILKRRMAAQHGDGSGMDRRAAILLEALPDAAAALEAATPLIAADVLARVAQGLTDGAADFAAEAAAAERQRIIAVARQMRAAYPVDGVGLFSFADYLEDVPVGKQGGA